MTRQMISCALGAALLAVGLTLNAGAASYVSDTNVIVNPHEVDVSTNSVNFVGTPSAISLGDLRMSSFTGGVSPPGPGQVASSFFDVFIDLDLDGVPYSGVGTGQLDITLLSTSLDPFGIPTSSYDLRMSGLNVTLQAPTGESVDLRESPSGSGGGGHGGGGGGGGGGTTSNGPRVRESPSGFFVPLNFPAENSTVYYTINSFFDIFTELSIDGGQTWIPASGPLHLESVPEPSTFVLGIASLAGLALVALRRKVRRG